jgi:hypothetical protein
MAVSHSILVIAWHLLTNDCDYTDLGGDYFVRRDADRARQRAVAQLQASATRSPSNPSPHDGDSPFRIMTGILLSRGFSFQDEVPGSSPGRPTRSERRGHPAVGALCVPGPHLVHVAGYSASPAAS